MKIYLKAHEIDPRICRSFPSKLIRNSRCQEFDILLVKSLDALCSELLLEGQELDIGDHLSSDQNRDLGQYMCSVISSLRK